MAPPKTPAKPKTVTDYIAAADKSARTKLREIRRAVRAATPKATAELKWSMPTHSYQRIPVMYAAFNNRISLFRGTLTVRAHKKELAKHDTSGSTVRFPLDQPLPAALIRRLVAWRVKESLEIDGKWRT